MFLIETKFIADIKILLNGTLFWAILSGMTIRLKSTVSIGGITGDCILCLVRWVRPARVMSEILKP